MHQLLTPAQDIRTDHLVLSPLTPNDVDDVLAILGAVDRVDAEHVVQEAIGSRIRHGLGAWLVRAHDGAVLGFGGATMRDGGWRLDVRPAGGAAAQCVRSEVLVAARREVDRIAHTPHAAA